MIGNKNSEIHFVVNWITMILFALLVIPVFSQGQDRPQARKLEVDPKPNCESEKMYLALFHGELDRDPSARGIIVVKGDPSSMRSNVIFESSVRNFLKIIGTDDTRYDVVRSISDNGTTWEIWIVPAGARPPSIERSMWSYKAKRGAQPYRFTWENVFDDDICPPVDDIRLFAEFLKANPNSKANIVIRGTAPKSVRRTKQRVLSTLIQTYKIPKTKIRVFLSDEIPTGMKPRVEYWFVP